MGATNDFRLGFRFVLFTCGFSMVMLLLAWYGGWRRARRHDNVIASYIEQAAVPFRGHAKGGVASSASASASSSPHAHDHPSSASASMSAATASASAASPRSGGGGGGSAYHSLTVSEHSPLAGKSY